MKNQDLKNHKNTAVLKVQKVNPSLQQLPAGDTFGKVQAPLHVHPGMSALPVSQKPAA